MIHEIRFIKTYPCILLARSHFTRTPTRDLPSAWTRSKHWRGRAASVVFQHLMLHRLGSKLHATCTPCETLGCFPLHPCMPRACKGESGTQHHPGTSRELAVMEEGSGTAVALWSEPCSPLSGSDRGSRVILPTRKTTMAQYMTMPARVAIDNDQHKVCNFLLAIKNVEWPYVPLVWTFFILHALQLRVWKVKNTLKSEYASY